MADALAVYRQIAEEAWEMLSAFTSRGCRSSGGVSDRLCKTQTSSEMQFRAESGCARSCQLAPANLRSLLGPNWATRSIPPAKLEPFIAFSSCFSYRHRTRGAFDISSSLCLAGRTLSMTTYAEAPRRLSDVQLAGVVNQMHCVASFFSVQLSAQLTGPGQASFILRHK